MSKTTKAVSAVTLDLANLRQNLAALSAERQRLDAELDRLFDEREKIRATPCPREEQVATLVDQVIVPAARERLKHRVHEQVSRQYHLPRVDAKHLRKHEEHAYGRTPTLLRNLSGPESLAVTTHDVAIALTPGAADELKRLMLEDWPADPETTMPGDERARRMEEIDKAIDEAKAQLDALDRAAADAGVVFE